MIYLITGVPGSGKTLYAVSTLVQQLAAQEVTLHDGHKKKRRLVVDGIKDLLLPHEQLAPGNEDAMGIWSPGDGEGIWNWPDWCQPGDIIVIDEVQRWWRPRGMGVKPPREIAALETHRHKGVDFVIITQNPMLIDQNVRRLIGRHQNIRRILGLQRAIIYDWDGCSVSMNPKNATATSYFSYPKSAYALYKSSELHTKQKQKIPLWMFVPVLAVVGGIVFGPKAFAVMSGSINGKGVETASKPAQGNGSTTAHQTAAVAPTTATAPPMASSAPLPLGGRPADLSRPQIAGCIRVADRCDCLDQTGKPVDVDKAYCQSKTAMQAGAPLQLANTEGPKVPDLADLNMQQFLQEQKRLHASF